VTRTLRPAAWAATLVAASAAGACFGQEPGIRWVAGPQGETRGAFEVVGLDPRDLAALAAASPTPDDWARLFSVTVDDGRTAGAKDRPPILGTYRLGRDAVRFEPRFPLDRGVAYRAVFDPSRLSSAGLRAKSIVEVVRLRPPESAATATVAHVYPTASTLPENLLKFYLHFSAPMSRGEVYRHIHLLDASGRPVRDPFLELGEELWDPSGTRFTLLLDPGRIKRGLRPREELGPILEEGKSYTLVIDRDWSDAEGRPLKDSFRKPFRAGPPDDRPPDPGAWTLSPPPAGTRDPLTVEFPEPLDHALLGRVVRVVDARGRPVPGEVVIERDETRWRFRPEPPWRREEYRLVVATVLEDLAGNSVGRPFEVDAFEPIRKEVRDEDVTRTFRPK
jgi:hypothetical protein